MRCHAYRSVRRKHPACAGSIGKKHEATQKNEADAEDCSHLVSIVSCDMIRRPWLMCYIYRSNVQHRYFNLRVGLVVCMYGKCYFEFWNKYGKYGNSFEWNMESEPLPNPADPKMVVDVDEPAATSSTADQEKARREREGERMTRRSHALTGMRVLHILWFFFREIANDMRVQLNWFFHCNYT